MMKAPNFSPWRRSSVPPTFSEAIRQPCSGCKVSSASPAVSFFSVST
jgi:hypothetical protein